MIMVQVYNKTLYAGATSRNSEKNVGWQTMKDAWQYIGWIVISVAFAMLGISLTIYKYLRRKQERLMILTGTCTDTGGPLGDCSTPSQQLRQHHGKAALPTNRCHVQQEEELALDDVCVQDSRSSLYWGEACNCRPALIRCTLSSTRIAGSDNLVNKSAASVAKHNSMKLESAKEEKAIASVRRDPIPAARFLQVYKQRKTKKQLAIEFKAISRNQEDHPTSAALRNVLLNVKQEVIPYDHSRVKLICSTQLESQSDYINASYIDGYSLLKEYIATQGPNSRCLAAFWQMIWQEGVRCIVMATGLFENAVQQCDKYWNDMNSSHKYVRHGDIHIWNEDTVFMAQLTVRTFRIQQDGGFEQRLVRQYEMVGFHEENPDPGLVLEVQRRVNCYTATSPGPILVHCRCGGGRTAVFIAVDYCLKQLEMEEVVDVYSAVLHLRRFRKNMVRSPSQYHQIYEAVTMYLQCGLTVYSASGLPSAYCNYYSTLVDSQLCRLDKEFQVLKVIVPPLSIGDCASGHRVENRNKSRDIMMLPPERARPYLMTTEQGDNATDFINAVYVDGYHQENTFLVTQWPKRKTVNDLWRLLFDFKITSLVVLNEVKFSRNYPRFWPKSLDLEVRYGPISVRYLGCGKYPNLIVRAFAIHKNQMENVADCRGLKRLYADGSGAFLLCQLLSHLQCPKFDYHVPDSLVKVAHHTMMLTSIPGCELREDDLVVKMFQVTGEESGRKGMISMPSKSLMAVIQGAEHWQHKTNPMNPICVLSKDGASRCGIFCAVHICCDQVKFDNEVDVFNAVRLVRHNRPQLVTSLEEYRYIYSFMAEFASSMVSRPQIVITGAEGDAFPTRHVPQAQDVLSTDESLSAHSSQAGSYETALDDMVDTMLPGNHGVQARLSACIAQLSPHLSHHLYISDRFAFPSTDSLLSFSHLDGAHAACAAGTSIPSPNSFGAISLDSVFNQSMCNHLHHGASVCSSNSDVNIEKHLERKQTSESFHSVGSTLHIWQT